jgi:hypothetical protein
VNGVGDPDWVLLVSAELFPGIARMNDRLIS